MNERLKTICDRLISNRDTVKSAFKWETGIMELTGAAVLSAEDTEPDVQKLKECEKIIKSGTSVFSNFRNHIKIPLICKMSASADPEKYFENVRNAYSILKKTSLSGSEYTAMAALTIADTASEDSYEKYALKTEEIYKRMKKDHRWLTSSEDVPFAALLALSDNETDALIEDANKNYDILKKSFSSKNSVQSLSHTLALADQLPEAKCAKAVTISEALKKANHPFGTYYELALLGSLAMITASSEEITEYIIEADDYLKEHKGFGNFVLGSKERRMFAAQCVLLLYRAECIDVNNVLVNSMINIAISIELCLLICASASVAAANAAASSN